MLRLGVHVSIARKIYEAVDRAVVLKCNTMQIFSRNPRSWKVSRLIEEDVAEFKRRREKAGIYPLAVHIPYIINLATSDKKLGLASRAAYIDDIKRADFLGAEYFVTHLGSHGGIGEDVGIKNFRGALSYVIEKAKPKVVILLELTAGAGSWIGYKFEHLKKIIQDFKEGEVGVCLDTAHVFEAGYDLRTKEALEETLSEFDRIIGLSNLKLIHLNDSKVDRGSRVDRHENIGKGKIGRGGFKAIVNHPKLKHLPFILETPKMGVGSDEQDLNTVRSLYRES